MFESNSFWQIFENTYFWIIFYIMLAIIIILILVNIKNNMLYFKKMEFSQALIKGVKIPAGSIQMNGSLVFPKFALDENNQPREKLPLIFLNHGWMNNIKNTILLQYAVALSLGGPYVVLLYECRGHGKTPCKRVLGSEMFDDIPKVFDYGAKLEGIDPDRLGFIGFSMGGEVALARAYPDERIKAIVSAVSPHNAVVAFTRKPEKFATRISLTFLKLTGVKPKKISDEENRKISPEFILDKNNSELNKRVFLIASENDSAIGPDEFKKNREVLNPPDDQFILFKKGGHTMMHQELIVIASALRFFKKML